VLTVGCASELLDVVVLRVLEVSLGIRGCKAKNIYTHQKFVSLVLYSVDFM